MQTFTENMICQATNLSVKHVNGHQPNVTAETQTRLHVYTISKSVQCIELVVSTDHCID